MAELRPKTYSYLTDDNDENKRPKGMKNFVTKGKLKFEDYENCLGENQLENEINCFEKNEHDVGSLKENQRIHKKNNDIF